MELTPHPASPGQDAAPPLRRRRPAGRSHRCAIHGGDLAPGVARRAFDTFVGENLDDGRRDDARLLVSELVANSVRHGRVGAEESIKLTFWSTETLLRVSVTDHGPGFDPASARRPADGDREGGRGLMFVEALADRWGVRCTGVTCVWFEMAC